MYGHETLSLHSERRKQKENIQEQVADKNILTGGKVNRSMQRLRNEHFHNL
jgi:hypothetical protein